MAVVRGRDLKHLENLKRRFKEKWHIEATPNRDYGFRMVMSKARWVEVATALAEEQNWHNFKCEVKLRGKTDARYSLLLHDIWDLVYKRLQGPQEMLRSPSRRKKMRKDGQTTGTVGAVFVFNSRIRVTAALCKWSIEWGGRIPKANR